MAALVCADRTKICKSFESIRSKVPIMTAKEEVLQQLGEQKELLNAKGPELKAEWLEALTKLFRQFAQWLADSVANNLLRVGEIPVEIQEERLGRYDAPSLKIITPRGQAIYVYPKSRIVAGGLGRVDFECGARKTILVRAHADHWQFAHLSPEQGGWSLQDLTESSFWETVRYLLS